MDNLKQLEDWSKGGLKQLEKFNPCTSPSHNPPSHIVLTPGKYEYTCPQCGYKTIFIVPAIVY